MIPTDSSAGDTSIRQRPAGTVTVKLNYVAIISFRIYLHCQVVGCKVRENYKNLVLGNSVTVARLTLDQLVGVRIPVPQFEKADFRQP